MAPNYPGNHPPPLFQKIPALAAPGSPMHGFWGPYGNEPTATHAGGVARQESIDLEQHNISCASAGELSRAQGWTITAACR